MNASTPERDRLREALVAALYGNYPYPTLAAEILREWDTHVPVRVEEPAGERVAQSANADVRECGWHFEGRNGEKRSCILLAGHEGHHMYPALPVPVGDETEALREMRRQRNDAYDSRDAWQETAEMAQRELDEALARVAGLETREALLLEELRLREESQIPVVPRAVQEKIERLGAREASLRELVDAARAVLDYEHTPRRAALSDLRAALDALADSGEAGS